MDILKKGEYITFFHKPSICEGRIQQLRVHFEDIPAVCDWFGLMRHKVRGAEIKL
jgi:hypothetical protein